MATKFSQPVSMRVTQEQYLRDLRGPLLAMGYREMSLTSFIENPILVNNYLGKDGTITNLVAYSAKIFNSHFIPDYNPEYFLAVAAMTSETFGIIGEWWKCIEDETHYFTNGKLYKCVEKYNNIFPTYRCNIFTKQGYIESAWHFRYFTKATLSDLINHFEPKINKNTNNMELTEKEKEVLAKLVNKDNEAIFEKIGVKRDKNPIKRLNTEDETLKSILHYICVALGSAEAIDRKDLIGRSFTLIAQNNFKFILHEKDGVQVLEITEK